MSVTMKLRQKLWNICYITPPRSRGVEKEVAWEEDEEMVKR